MGALSGLSGLSGVSGTCGAKVITTVTLTVSAANDGYTEGYKNGAYPPDLESATSTSSTWHRVGRHYGAPYYYTSVALLRFDLSAYAGTVTAATLKLKTDAGTAAPANDDSRSVTIEHYDPGAAITFAGDWTNTASGTAHAGTSISSLSAVDGTVNDFVLINPGSIVLGGWAGFRVHCSGGQPTGTNRIYFYSGDSAGKEPQLELTFEI